MKTIEQKAKKVPTIRFAGFDDEWVEKKLGDVANSFGYGLNAAAMPYDGINKYLRITDIDDLSREFKKDDLTTPDFDLVKASDYRLDEGDLLFARTGASVGKTFIYKKNDGLVYFAGFLIRTKIKSEYDSKFIFQNTLTNLYDKFVKITSQRSGQPGINAQEYADYSLLMPKLNEQQKIGSFFSNIDSLISLEQKKYDKLVQVKKSMLEKMFPKEGATVPEIRFAGFSGDWEKDEFSNIITVHPFKPYLAEPHIGGKIEVIQQGNDPIAGYANGKPFEDYKNVTLFGDHTVSLYKARNPFFVASDGLKILSSKKTSPNFFYHMLDRFKPIPEGYKRHFMILLERECYYPKEKTEQNLISSYLNSLDSLISLQQRKLEKLKNIKKSLLEKMFV
jgi:type I restriction enzyme S subunit